MSKAKVSLHECQDYDKGVLAEILERVFSEQGGLENLVGRGDRVLIKPNLIAPVPRKKAAVTDPTLILTLATLLKDYGARPFVGDSPAWGDTSACMHVLGLAEPLRRIDVPWTQLDRPRRIRIDGTHVGISEVALEADRIINLPKLKTHS